MPEKKTKPCIFFNLPVVFCFFLLIILPEITQGFDLETIKTLTLAETEKIALEDNPTIMAAEARLNKARQILKKSLSSYFPRIDFTASAARVNMSDNSYNNALDTARVFNPLATVENPEKYYKTGITASWILFNGFERKYERAKALYGKKAGDAALADAKRVLLFSVALNFYAAQLALENIAIASADEAFYDRLVKEAKLRHKAGTGSLSDVLNFRISVNSAKSIKIEAKQNFDAILSSLGALINITDYEALSKISITPLEKDEKVDFELLKLQSQIDYAMAHRPDIKQMEAALMSAGSAVKKARAGYYPTVVFSAHMDGERAGDERFESDDFGDTVGLNLSYNLFAGGLTMAKIGEAKSIMKEAMEDLKILKLSIISDVRTAYTGLKAAQNLLALQRTNADLVQKNRDLINKEYLAGKGSLLRLNEAQKNLIQAKSRLALALVSIGRAKYSLDAATSKNIERYYE